MKNGLVFLFPGQGGQYVGMAKDLFNDFACVRHTFYDISEVAKTDVQKICFDSSESELNRIENTSLAIFSHSVSVAKIIEQEFNMPFYKIADAVAGHSMGQYSALCCTGALDLQSAVRLLMKRSEFMKAANVLDAGMLAVIGLDTDKIKYIVQQARNFDFVDVANFNSNSQFVLSGKNRALDVCAEIAKKLGAYKVVRLNVAVPAHSALMYKAGDMLRDYLNSVDLQSPKTNLFSNQTADLISESDKIKQALVNQMTTGVRWQNIMEKFPIYNLTKAYELGPAKALTGLVNRANVGCKATYTDKLKNVKNMLAGLDKWLTRTC